MYWRKILPAETMLRKIKLLNQNWPNLILIIILASSMISSISASAMLPYSSYKYSNNHNANNPVHHSLNNNNNNNINNNNNHYYQIGNSNYRVRGRIFSPTKTLPSPSPPPLPPPLQTNQQKLINNTLWSSSSLATSQQQPPPAPPSPVIHGGHLPSTKVHGSVNCMLAIFDEISWCNHTYYQSLTNIIVKGYRKESSVYRKQFCCGHWSRERCIFKAAQRKCDSETYEKIREDSIFMVDSVGHQATTDQLGSSASGNNRHVNNLIRGGSYINNFNCDKYEHNSPICHGARPYLNGRMFLIIFVVIILFVILSAYHP